MRGDDNTPRTGTEIGAAPRPQANEATPRDTSTRASDGADSAAQEQPWVPKVEMPKGGGAITGIGERFEANAFTGAASMSIPIATSPGRGAPSLALTYASGSGNGPFGQGWSLSAPAIARKTQQELPQYRDGVEGDTFVLSGSEDLVPVRDAEGERVGTEQDGFVVYPYRPRVEGGFARIERWVSLADGSMHWRVRTADNVLSIYGVTAASRMADPDDARRVFAWQLDEVRDDRGNIARYHYKAEDGEGATLVADLNRGAVAGVYLKRIEYGNRVPYVAEDFAFEVVFDYGEHDLSPEEVRPWPARPDPFSNFRAGFERRTRRRCARVLMFHRFAELSGPNVEPRLVAATEFTYDDAPHLSKLVTATPRAYDFIDGEYQSAEGPAVYLEYSAVDFAPRLVPLSDLKNVPAGIDGSSFRFVDLDGEGLPGIVSQQGDALYYKRPLGEGRYGPLSVVGEQPSTAKLGRGGQLADVDGDGRLEFVAPRQGTYARVAAVGGRRGGWAPMQPFEDVPNVDLQNPDVQQLDVDGDGRSDLLLVEHDRFVWWPSRGRAGWGPPRFAAKPQREAEGPAVLFSDGTATLHLADMSGDGLQDIVRVRNGAVHYWPNLGHGRFGRRITMDAPPFFVSDDQFHPAYVRLADLDGSGTTDIVYLDPRGARAWLNRSGNGFSEVQALRPFPGVDGATAVEVRDLFGKGTAALVWSSAADWAKPNHVLALDLLPQKPHLLTAVRNDLGAQTRFSYEPSTTQALRDKAAGRPWATTLPFPVQVLTRVEQYDAIARRRFVQTYAYHHGHYDGLEREFRGFAMVERWDTESYEDFSREGLFEVELYDQVEAQLHQPPVYTKTWFHTGAYVGHAQVSRQLEVEYWDGDPAADGWRLADTVLPAGLSAQECLEATRALRGRALRTEVYSLDGSDAQALPHAVTETNFTVRVEQAARSPSEVGRFEKPQHAVVFAHARESLSFAYDRDPQNPRVGHEAVLDVDAYGHVTRSVAVAYPARTAAIPEQGEGAIVVSEASFCDALDGPDVYRTGVPAQSWSYALHGLPPSPLSKLDLDTLRTALDSAPAVSPEDTDVAGLARRLLSQTRAYYWDDDQVALLPLGQCGTRTLPHSQRAAALSEGQRAAVFGDDLDATLMTEEGGYVFDAGLWWTRSGTQVFDPAQFYLPVLGRDPFGHESTVEYDAHHLFVTRIEGPLGGVATFAHDYRVLAPTFATDPNGNRTQVGFDIYGRVSWVAAMGTEGAGEGDTPQDPTARFTYDVFAWRDRGEPPSAFSEVRETHGDPNTRWQRSWTYFDAGGTTILSKATAEPGDAPQRDANGDLVLDGDGNLVLAHSDPRYVGTGRIVFDNKGNPVQQYEPYFSGTADYESEPQLREQGVSALLHYDPLGRLLRTDLPDGTFATSEFTPWHQVDRDGGDNVLASSWYAERSGLPAGDRDLRAANLSAAYANTPTTTHVDSQGRPVRVVTANIGDVEALTRTELDITGNPLRIVDARDNVAQENVYGLGGLLLQENSVDAGQRRALPDVTGNPLRAFDARGFVQRWRYDEGLRPTHHFVTYPNPNGPNPERLVTRTVYGEFLPTPEALNLRGRAHRVYDGAGVSTAEAYDFAGNLLSSARQLATEFRETPDWSALSDLEDVTDLEQAAAADLETEVFRTTSTFDALGRPTSQSTPEGTTVRLDYNDASLLERVTANVRGSANETTFVENIDYDEKGRRERIAYGNGTTTSYDYDRRSFRLTRLRTTDASRTFQDLRYTYDAVGNIVEQRDDAQADLYVSGALVSARARYEYDALYQLTQAEGREHAGQNSSQPTAFGVAAAGHPQDATAFRRYEERYVYDLVGNILQMQHAAIGDTPQNWTRSYQYAEDGNHLLATSLPGQPGTFDTAYLYNEHGSLRAMPHLDEIVWDHAERMQSADLGGGGTVYFVYDSAGVRVRKVREHQGGATDERVYLAAFELYRERNTSGALQLERETLHISDDTGRVCDLETRTVQSGVPEPNPTTHYRYQYSNHLGSATLELSASAEVISYEEYHPYGTSSYRAVNSAIDVSAARYRYTAMERDEETGLSLHGARYYACWLGRWTASDPIGLGDGPNRYAYVSASPTASIDPSGESGLFSEVLKHDAAWQERKQQREADSKKLDEKIGRLASAYESRLREADQQRVAYLEAVAKKYGHLVVGGRVTSDFEPGAARGPARMTSFKFELWRMKKATQDLPLRDRKRALNKVTRRHLARISWRMDAGEDLAFFDAGLSMAAIKGGKGMFSKGKPRKPGPDRTILAPLPEEATGSTLPNGTRANASASVSRYRGTLHNDYDPAAMNDPEFYVTAEGKSGSHIYAEGSLVGEGVLEMGIYAEEARAQGYPNASGGYAFQEIVSAAEATGEMESIRAIWVDGDNLAAFRKAGGGVGATGAENTQAVKSTWTYSQAEKAGYGNVSEITVTDSMVRVLFVPKGDQ